MMEDLLTESLSLSVGSQISLKPKATEERRSEEGKEDKEREVTCP